MVDMLLLASASQIGIGRKGLKTCGHEKFVPKRMISGKGGFGLTLRADV